MLSLFVRQNDKLFGRLWKVMALILAKAIIAVAGLAILVATFLVYGRNGLKQAIISIAILVAAVILMATCRDVGA